MSNAPAAAPVSPRGTAIRRTPLERIEYAIIISTLLLLVVVTVQPILNLIAMSLSDPSRVAGMSGLAVLPDGFSLDVWVLLFQHPLVQSGIINSIFITTVGTLLSLAATALMACNYPPPCHRGKSLNLWVYGQR